MKRTVELVLGISALALQLLLILLIVPFLIFFSFQFPELTSPKFEAWYAWFAVAVLVTGFFSGLVAMLNIKKNAKKAGVILLITGIFMFFLTLGATLIQTILLVIAGSMCLIRQPKDDPVV